MPKHIIVSIKIHCLITGLSNRTYYAQQYVRFFLWTSPPYSK